MTWLSHKVRFLNWVYKLVLHHRYGPMKKICTPSVTYVTLFLYKWYMNLIWFDIFFQMWMCLFSHIVLKNDYVHFGNCKYYVYIFYKVPIIKRLAITSMYCNRLHAWWSTQSLLATLLFSLIAHRWVGLQTLWRFRLKDLSIDEMVGAWYFGCLSGPPGFTCWISFAPVFSFIYCWVLIFASFLVISWFVCSGRWCIDMLGVFHANQISMCLDPHLN